MTVTAVDVSPVDVEYVGPNEDLPEGWRLVRIRDICGINPPKPAKDALPADAPVTFVPMPAVDAESGTIANPSVRPFSEVRGGFTAFRDGDVIFAKITPCMENGKAAVARDLVNGFGFGSSEFHVLRPTSAVLSEYIYHYLRQESFRRAAEEKMTGSVGQRRVPSEFIADSTMPLPPLDEQKRIVFLVDSLLVQLARTKQRTQNALAILKRFRQSVLAAACSGRLTEYWRDVQDEMASSCRSQPLDNETLTDASAGSPVIAPSTSTTWQSSTFGDACTYVTVGHVGPMVGEYRESGVPFLRSLNIKEFRLDYANLKFISPDFHRRLRKSALLPGDIVIVRSGNPGTACVIPRGFEDINCSDLVIARPSDKLVPGYGCIVLNSVAVRAYVDQNKVGIAQGHFNVASLRQTPLPVPPVTEQDEIVRRVETLFRLADGIERRVAAVMTRVDSLTQATLAKAFRGELVPADAELAKNPWREYETTPTMLERVNAVRRVRDTHPHEFTPYDGAAEKGRMY